MKYSLSRFSISPKHLKAAQRALNKLVSSVQQEDPGLVYLVFREPDSPAFVALASFQDEKDYRRHANSRHVARFARAILPLCSGTPSFTGLELFTATTRVTSRSASGRKSPMRSRSRQRAVRPGNTSRRKAR